MTNKNVRIAFSGKICSGKTTAANILSERIELRALEAGVLFQKTVVRLSVASKVKELAIDLFGMDPAKKDRKLLQVLGQKMKEIDSEVWIRALTNQVKQCKDSHIIIDDVRFPNEFDALRKLNFVIIRLDIDPVLQLERLKNTYPESWETHVLRLDNISETALDNCKDFDYVIDINHGTTNETIRKYLCENLIL